MRRCVALALTLCLAACNNGAPEVLDDAALKKRAAALERSANETTDALINQIEAESRDDATPENRANDTEPANASKAK